MTDTITEHTATDCLLIVDDEQANIQVLGTMLGKVGFEILPATSGEQALRRLAARRVDLILLDLLLPGMDGIEVCRRIQENPEWKEIPIIFLSAVDDKNLIVRALESGGVDYIIKPFNKPELLSRVRTHLMLKSMRDHLRRLAQDKEELLAMISHHMQNHLAAMHMSAQLVLKRAETNNDAGLRLLASNIMNASTETRTFVRTFLDNSAADHGLSIKLEAISLAAAAARALKPYEETAKRKEIVLRREFTETGTMVLADPIALNQVLDNLISNSVKFSPPGKEILVSVGAGRNHAECRVRDQGPGFTEQDKSRLFQRYARLSAKPTGGEPSSGLGLSIARKLARAMNGTLTCESNPGDGAVFILRLPLAAATTQG
jgi:two-component system sensor histidine kinase/response regulator